MKVAERSGRSTMKANSTSAKLETSNHLQESLPTGPTGKVHHGTGGVPWMKRCALTTCPGGAVGKAVYMVLASFVDGEGKDAWPSIEKLAGMAGVSKRSARTALRLLEAAGLVSTQRGTGRGNKSIYTVNLKEAGDASLEDHKGGKSRPQRRQIASLKEAGAAAEVIREVIREVISTKQRATVPNQVQAKKSQSQTRHYCETHKRSWPGQYGAVCFLCDRENLKPKSGGDSFRDLMRRKGLISPEDDAAYDARQVTFRAKMFPRSDARTRKIDQERRARLSPA